MKQGMLMMVLAGLSLSVPAFAEAPKAPTQLRPPSACQKNPALCKNVVANVACPDPGAQIEFRLVRRTSQFAGVIEVKASVKNFGGPYVTGPNQQLLNLYEVVPGAAPRLVASKPFANLASGEVASLTFSRTWNASSPAEGEFPPSYRAIISYDPDILLDGNVKNDDCRAANNVIEQSGTQINALFH
ncbi:MAG TPA: hypothetical protein VFQ35_22110 [Polyangiaceae bacterium]|nr:hypothetical protein [Polyangiaceae bacterium]